MISVIIVNFHSADLTQKAVSSVFQEHEDLEVLIVDNTCTDKEKRLLEDTLRKEKNIRFIFNNTNVGFAKACNQAFAISKGEYILLLNPDAYVTPPCLRALKDFMSKTPGAGAVSPQVYWDSSMEYFFPHYTYPSPFQDFLLRLTVQSKTFEKYYSLYKRGGNLRLWRALKAVCVANLHGGVVLLKKSAVEQAGGLFDERFFMFYEDTDLFLRLKKNGHKLYILPQVKAVHNYMHKGHKLELMAHTSRIFYEKHFNGNLLLKIAALIPNRKATRNYIDYGIWSSPPVFSVPTQIQTGFLFEWSPTPLFSPAIGYFGRGESFTLSKEVWSFLDEGLYYCRITPQNAYCLDYTVYSWSKTP